MRDVVLCADAREALADLADASVDAIVTDPPAGVSFMNLAFDSDRGGRDQWVAWLAGILSECRRVVKPGGYALVWALPRTSHWTALALEEAGWTIRDSVHHIQGAGFPKSKSCLKPAHEVWWLAKAPGPLQPLHIDACRVPTGGEQPTGSGDMRGRQTYAQDDWTRTRMANGGNVTPPAGRWPPNLLLSHVPPAPDGTGGCRAAGTRRVRGSTAEQVQSWECVDGCPVKVLDEQAGPRTSGAKAVHHIRTTTKGRTTWGSGQGGGILQSPPEEYPASTGSASRFFPTFAAAPEPENAVPFRYEPKASRRDRGEGNTHTTVKPTALMAWLVKLAAKPGDVILDPFCGSGSTLVACVREGMHFLGIDQNEQYCEIARRRVAYEHEQQTGPLFCAAGVCGQEGL